MVGKYDLNNNNIRTMPSFESNNDTVDSKILNHNNASYVDAFFTYLSCKLLHSHNFIHGMDFYGSYIGVQKQFRVCITDDIDFLKDSTFFNENVGKLFYIEDHSRTFNGLDSIGRSRRNQKKLTLLDINGDDLSIECDLLTEYVNHISNKDADASIETETEIIYAKSTSSHSSHYSCSDSDVNYSSEESDSNESGSSSDSNESGSCSDSNESGSCSDSNESEEEIFGYVNNFPIQMICMEKCEGTLDNLFITDEINVETAASYLFQIIMILLVYQKAFNFTHNDLHTNNIMYISTELPFLYYKYAGKNYKVPTFGRIIKIIDFGRGIYKFQGKQFCSDSFAPDGDAVTQYNTEPFLNNNRARLEPNNSFDLCRLGSSIFDFIMDIDDDYNEMDDLQKTICRWCSDDNGKNVLYKKNGEERYPSFKLYKMIARTVHKHTPESQLDEPYFKQFESTLSDDDNKLHICMDIDTIPQYI
jgi:hypothetical protein